MKLFRFNFLNFTAAMMGAALLIFSISAVMPSVHAHLHEHTADSHQDTQGDEASCSMQNHAAADNISSFETRFDLTRLEKESPEFFKSTVIPGTPSPLHSRAPPFVLSLA